MLEWSTNALVPLLYCNHNIHPKLRNENEMKNHRSTEGCVDYPLRCMNYALSLSLHTDWMCVKCWGVGKYLVLMRVNPSLHANITTSLFNSALPLHTLSHSKSVPLHTVNCQLFLQNFFIYHYWMFQKLVIFKEIGRNISFAPKSLHLNSLSEMLRTIFWNITNFLHFQ
jgi:hypothetical protein